MAKIPKFLVWLSECQSCAVESYLMLQEVLQVSVNTQPISLSTYIFTICHEDDMFRPLFQAIFRSIDHFAPCNARCDMAIFLVTIIFNTLKTELNPICYLLALLRAHNFLHVSRIRVKLLSFRLLMSYIYIYIYIYIYLEHPFLMFLDHTQRRTTVGRTPLDE